MRPHLVSALGLTSSAEFPPMKLAKHAAESS